MHLYKTLRKLVLISLAFIPVAANAQFYNRLEIGYSYVMATGQYSGTSGFYNLNGSYGGDTIVKRNITAKAGYGEDIGLCIPLKRVGRINMWALSIHFMANEFIWSGLNQGFSADGTFIDPYGIADLDGATLQMAVPIGVDYKIGTDAVCSKKVRFGVTFGAGVMPSFNETVMINVNGAGGGLVTSVNPFVKAEVAVFGGLCFKLRALYSFGNVPYIDQNKDILAVTSGPFTVTGTSNLTLSFIIMPFAWHWKEESWATNYGRYNRYLD